MSSSRDQFSRLVLDQKLLKSEDQLQLLFKFIDLLIKANEVINLTAIVNEEEALFKHLYDSLCIIQLPEYQTANKIIDVGSGGGIPCLPLAIASPEKRFYSLDSTQKKINFQSNIITELNLTNINPIWGRAEEIARESDFREQFDLAVARAVAATSSLAEITLPFVKVGQHAIFYKSKDYQTELAAAHTALAKLNGVVKDSITYDLPLGYGFRSLIIINKSAPTPTAYPRKPGVPQKKPL